MEVTHLKLSNTHKTQEYTKNGQSVIGTALIFKCISTLFFSYFSLKLGRLLQRQFRAYRNADPKPKQQKALSLVVIKEMAKNQTTASSREISQLGIGAFFYAMRSCKYLKVQQAEKRCTDIFATQKLSLFH